MDVENLSKEELVRLIKSQKNEAQVIKGTVCKFKPTKQGLSACTEQAVTAWGFCKKHSKTIQSIHAEKEYEQKKREEEERKKEEEKKKEAAAAAAAAAKERTKIDFAHPVKPPVTKKIIIKPNKYGRYEEPESHILFNFETKCAYGVQGPNGKISSLTPKHIAICEKNKWKYIKPVKEEEEEEEDDDDDEDDEDEEEEEEEEVDEDEFEDEEEEDEDDDEESEYSDSD
jgi:hypothetical protein